MEPRRAVRGLVSNTWTPGRPYPCIRVESVDGSRIGSCKGMQRGDGTGIGQPILCPRDRHLRGDRSAVARRAVDLDRPAEPGDALAHRDQPEVTGEVARGV